MTFHLFLEDWFNSWKFFQFLFVWKGSYPLLKSQWYFAEEWDLGWKIFLFNTLNMSFYSFLTWMIFYRRSIAILMLFCLYLRVFLSCCFKLAVFTFWLYHFGVLLFGILWASWIRAGPSFQRSRKFSVIIFSARYFYPFSFSSTLIFLWFKDYCSC